jgi:trimeric autotransporter adhesin
MSKIVAIFLLLSLPGLSLCQTSMVANRWGNDPSLSCSRGCSSGPEHRVTLPDSRSSEIHDPASLSWDATIAGYGNNPDGMTVKCFASEGNDLYIAGDFQQFDTVSADFLVHYNRVTKVWDALDGGPHNTVNAVAVHKGKLYVAGNFSGIGSGDSIVNFIAMWDGSAWHSLAGGMDGVVNSIAFVGDTLYAGGDFTMAGSNTAYGLAFWDGTQWAEAFGGTSYPVQTLLATHDSLFVGGLFNYVGSELGNSGPLAHGAAMLRNGIWTTFGTGFWTSTFAIYQGKLWAGGDYYSTSDNTLVYNIGYWDGSSWVPTGHDTIVGTSATGGVYNLTVIGDTLVALGSFSSMAGVEANGIAVYVNGNWSAMSGGLYGYGRAAIDFDSKWYIGGRFTKAGGVATQAIATLGNGAGDIMSWSPVARMIASYIGWQSDVVNAIATTDRYVFIGGNFTTIAGQTCNHVAAWDKQTQTWTTLGQGVDGDVFSLAVAGDNLIVGGSFNHAGAVLAHHIASCNITSKLWSAMGTGAKRTVSAIAYDGNVYASIYNEIEDGEWTDHLGKWDGSRWSVFGDGLISGYIQALVIPPNKALHGTSMYAGGSFINTASGIRVNRIAQLVDGSWGSMNSGVNSTVYALAPAGNSLFVGGNFSQADGLAATALAEWDGANWNPIGTGFDRGVYALAADGSGGVYAGGGFSTVAGTTRDHLVHWNGTSFGTVSGGINNDVNVLATDAVALYAGGWFETAGNSHVPSLHFAALDGAGASVEQSGNSASGSVSIFPNPASDFITVENAEGSVLHVNIENVMGCDVGSGYRGPASGKIDLDLSKLPSGTYFLQIETSKGIVMSRVVKE